MNHQLIERIYLPDNLGKAEEMSIRTKAEFSEAALEYIDSLYRLALYATASEDDAQKLVQNTYLRAYSSFDEYKADTNFKAWLLGMLNGEFVYSEYGKSRKVAQLCGENGQETKSPSDYDILGLIGKLPSEYRMAILLMDVEGLSHKEVAGIIGCSEEEFMARLYKGRKLIEKDLPNREPQSVEKV